MQLSYKAQKALDLIRQGSLMVEHADGEQQYICLPSGLSILSSTFKELQPHLSPLNDGLFEGDSQQWVAV